MVAELQAFHTAEQQVHEHLRRKILTGELVGDSVINQEQIANELGLSRIPVRDALRRLQSDGFIRVLANKRTVVTKLSWPQVVEIFEIRALLEGLAARHAVPLLSNSDLTELRIMAETLDRVASDVDRWVTKHHEFHDYIAHVAGKPRVRMELQRLRDIVVPYLRIFAFSHGYAELSGSRHIKLVEALERRNPRAANHAFVRHVETAIEEIGSSISTIVKHEQEKDSAAKTGQTKATSRRPKSGRIR